MCWYQYSGEKLGPRARTGYIYTACLLLLWHRSFPVTTRLPRSVLLPCPRFLSRHLQLRFMVLNQARACPCKTANLKPILPRKMFEGNLEFDVRHQSKLRDEIQSSNDVIVCRCWLFHSLNVSSWWDYCGSYTIMVVHTSLNWIPACGYKKLELKRL